MTSPKPPGMPKVPVKKSDGKVEPISKDLPNVSDSLMDLDEPSVSPPTPATSKTLRMVGPPPVPAKGTVPGARSVATTLTGTPPTTKKMPSSKKAPKESTVKPLKATGGLLGNILVENQLLTEKQRDICLKLQVQSGNTFRIGELAVKQGFLDEEDLRRALDAQKRYVKSVRKEQSRMIKLPDEVANVQSIGASDSNKLLKWLSSALKYGASDLHVMCDQPLVLRHMGRLVRSKEPPLNKDAAKEAVLSVLDESDQKRLAVNYSVVKCFELPSGGRVRANIFRHMDGINGTFRLIPAKAPSLVSLHLPSLLAKFTTYAQGLVLITGPIGCGKTTTMSALIDIVNQERQNHIITIERPTEFVHSCSKSLVTQRQVGLHTRSFASALRAALREDPDVIAVGEMNDIETARLAVSAAETGHLVFATLHTENAVRTINRVLDIFPPDEQNQVRSMLSESLRGVISQRLVVRKDEPGRIPVVELLFTTPAMRNLIREKKVYQLPNAIKMSRSIGNCTFLDHGKELLEAGIISEKTFSQLQMEEK